MYIIYKHTNKVTNKSYIGQTKYSIEERLKQHYRDARNSNKNRNSTRPFHLALLKYTSTDWNSEILKENLSKKEASTYEIHYIKEYDTYNNGYNATLGGDYLLGYTPPKGNDHHCTDTTEYTFYHRYYPKFTGNVKDFSERYSLNSATVRKVVNDKLGSVKGWVLDFNKLYRYKDIKVPKISLKSINYTPCKQLCPICKSVTIASKNKTCINCRDTSGKNNGMYGKKRPEYVKEAVSNRMRNKYADQTLRDWVHKDHGIIKQVRSIDLRDKFKLNISHLKKITDGKQSQHKGWKLHV